MALAHKTIVGGIQIDRKGDVSVLLKLFVADGADEYSETNYRFTIGKGDNVAAKGAAANAALAAMGRQQIPAKAAAVIKNTLDACWAAMDA